MLVSFLFFFFSKSKILYHISGVTISSISLLLNAEERTEAIVYIDLQILAHSSQEISEYMYMMAVCSQASCVQ